MTGDGCVRQELCKYKTLGEIEYSKTLSPLECIKRYEKNKILLMRHKEKKLNYFKTNTNKQNSYPTFTCINSLKATLILFEKCILWQKVILM